MSLRARRARDRGGRTPGSARASPAADAGGGSGGDSGTVKQRAAEGEGSKKEGGQGEETRREGGREGRNREGDGEKNRKTEEGKGSGGRREGEEGGRKRKGGKTRFGSERQSGEAKEGKIEGRRRKKERGGTEGGRDEGAACELLGRMPAQAESEAPEEGGWRGPVGLGERSLEAKRRHGAAPDRGWLPAPAPVPSVPPALRGPGAPRPAPPRTARAPPARCLPDPEPVRAGSAGCDSRGEPEAVGGEGTEDAPAGKDADADLPGGQLQRSRIGAYWATRGHSSPFPHHTCAPLRPCRAFLYPRAHWICQEGLFLTSCPSVRGPWLPPHQPRGQEGGEEGAAPPPAG